MGIHLQTDKRLLFYQGNFAAVGGIEQFSRDFLTEIAPNIPNREMLFWGSSPRDNVLLQDILASGVTLNRSLLRHGSRYHLPDHWLIHSRARRFASADIVVLGRGLTQNSLDFIRRTVRRAGRGASILLITPYRPREYWDWNPPPSYLNNFDHIIVQTEQFQKDLDALGFKGHVDIIPLIPPTCDQVKPFPRDSHGTIRIGYLGRLVGQKNVDYALRVFERLRSQVDQPRVEFHIFGDGPCRAPLESLASTLAAANRIKFHGVVSRAQIFDCIDSCHFFLNTSFTEGQNLTALEFFSRGRPLVATPVGSHPELLSDGTMGMLAPANDPNAYAAQLLQLMDRIRREEITPGSIAQAYCTRFDRRKIVARYVDVILSRLA